MRYLLAAIIACTLCAPGFAQTEKSYKDILKMVLVEKAQIASVVMGQGALLHDNYYSNFYKSIISFWAIDGQIYRCHLVKGQGTFKHPTFICDNQVKHAETHLSAEKYEKYQSYLEEPIGVLANNKKPISKAKDVDGTDWTYHKWINNLWACAVLRGQYLVCRHNADPIVFDLGN